MSSGSKVSFRKETRDTITLPANKSCQYFLSHKKSHSTHGVIPGQIAENMHDSAELLGFIGWFDIDSLKTISKQALQDGIQGCCTMVVLLNDETAESEWCRFEWEVARELGLPVKVLCDLERCTKESKQSLLSKMLTDFPHLCSHQWSDYTARHRRECLAEVCEFLQAMTDEQIDAEEKDDDWEEQPDEDVRMTFGDWQDAERLMHPWFENLCLFAGVPVSLTRSRRVFYWIWFLHANRALSMICILVIAQIHERAPLHTDHFTDIALQLLLLLTAYVPARLRQIFHGRHFTQILRGMENAASREVGREIFLHSKIAAVLSAVAGLLFGAAFVSAYVPLTLASTPTSSEASSGWLDAFALMGCVVVTVNASILPTVAFSSLAEYYIILRISTVRISSSFDALHPQIAAVGFSRFVRVNPTRRLILAPKALISFHECWNVGFDRFLDIQKQMCTLCTVTFLYGLAGLPIVFGLVLSGFRLSATTMPWAHCIRLGGLHATAIASFLHFSYFVPLYCVTSLRNLRRQASKIVCEEPSHYMFLTDVFSSSDLRFVLFGVFPITPLATAAAAGLVLLSVVPWFWVW